MTFLHQHPSTISTNRSTPTNGGFIVERTMVFDCPNGGCQQQTEVANSKFIPSGTATEETGNVPTPLPSAPAPPSGASLTPTWTTDPNLRLTISYTNFTNAIPWPVTASIPSGAGSFHTWWSNGVQVTTNVNQFVWTTNSVGVSVICGPAVMIKYPTQVGKIYKCQASDDAKATWQDGYPVVGTGGFIVNYEAVIKTNRIYRVVEL